MDRNRPTMDPSALSVALGVLAYGALTVALIPAGRLFLERVAR